MHNARLVTLLAAVLLAVSATAAPCKPCNSGPRHNNLLPLSVPAAATNYHLGDLETLVGHAKGDVFKASADAMMAAVPDAAKDLVPGAALAEGTVDALGNAVSYDATGGGGGFGVGNDATATANAVNEQE